VRESLARSISLEDLAEGIKRVLAPYIDNPSVAERHARMLANAVGSRDFTSKFEITRLAIVNSLRDKGITDQELVEEAVEGVKRSILDLAGRIRVKPAPEASISVSVSHVSEREELYYQVVESILEKRVVKTFYITSTNHQYELGIYCYNGLTYEPCEKELEALIEEMTRSDKNTSKKPLGGL